MNKVVEKILQKKQYVTPQMETMELIYGQAVLNDCSSGLFNCEDGGYVEIDNEN